MNFEPYVLGSLLDDLGSMIRPDAPNRITGVGRAKLRGRDAVPRGLHHQKKVKRKMAARSRALNHF